MSFKGLCSAPAKEQRHKHWLGGKHSGRKQLPETPALVEGNIPEKVLSVPKIYCILFLTRTGCWNYNLKSQKSNPYIVVYIQSFISGALVQCQCNIMKTPEKWANCDMIKLSESIKTGWGIVMSMSLIGLFFLSVIHSPIVIHILI